MTKKEFQLSIKENLEKFFSADKGYSISIKDVLKNNDTTRLGIIIQEENGNICPTYYIDDFYEDYIRKKKTLDEIANIIISSYEECEDIKINYKDFSLDYDDCKDKIIYRLISRERNNEKLKDIPYVEYLDFAIIFYIVTSIDKSHIEGVCISNDLIKRWDISRDELYEISKNNTPNLFPYKLESMKNIVIDNNLISKDDHEMLEAVSSIPDLFVLSNDYGIHGASSILYPKLLEELSAKFDSNLILIPSSIHEFILIPQNEEPDYKELSEMITSINEEHVAPEEVLSDRPYFYSKIDNQIFS